MRPTSNENFFVEAQRLATPRGDAATMEAIDAYHAIARTATVGEESNTADMSLYEKLLYPSPEIRPYCHSFFSILCMLSTAGSCLGMSTGITTCDAALPLIAHQIFGCPILTGWIGCSIIGLAGRCHYKNQPTDNQDPQGEQNVDNTVAQPLITTEQPSQPPIPVGVPIGYQPPVIPNAMQ